MKWTEPERRESKCFLCRFFVSMPVWFRYRSCGTNHDKMLVQKLIFRVFFYVFFLRMVPVGFPKCARNFWCHLGVVNGGRKGKKAALFWHTKNKKPCKWKHLQGYNCAQNRNPFLMAINYLDSACVKLVSWKCKELMCVPIIVPFLRFLLVRTNIRYTLNCVDFSCFRLNETGDYRPV